MVPAVLVALLASTSPAGAATSTVSSGSVTATFIYSGTFPQSKGSRLTISRAGKVVYERPVRSKWCADQCWPSIDTANKVPLHIVHLQAKGQADVVLDLYSGGAHCCSVEQVYARDATTGTYTKSEFDFGDPGARLVKIGHGGSFDFLSADDAFAYAFTDYAASGMPIEILSFSKNSFHNVTRSFPSLIAHDAAQWLAAFDASASSHYQDTVGLVAAWAADQDMLGHSAAVGIFLAAQEKAGHLNSALYPIEPSGHKYVVSLQSFLRKHGYVK